MLASELIPLIERHTGRPGVRRGHNTRLLCPGHDDHNPSLDVAAAADGTALVFCRSRGCSYEQILDALGVQRDPADANLWTPSGPAVAHYPYQDERGQLLYEVCRTDSKQFPQRRPDPTSRSGWRWKLGDVRRVLYHLPDVIAAVEHEQLVYLVEGEKDADRLRRLGHCATCNPGGAGKWRAEYAQTLRGARVCVVADRDGPGYDHAYQVAASLAHAGARVELRQPAVEREHADVSDHLDEGRSLDELALLQAAPEDADALRFTVRTAAEVMALPEPDEGYELLGPLVCRGARTIVVGDTGHGKTTLCFQMLRAVLLGEQSLGHEGAGVGPVLVVDLEQGIRSIKRGLREAQLDTRGDVLYITVPDGLALDQSPEQYAALEHVLADRHPAVVLLDPYYKAHRADDPNQERPIIDLMRSLDGLRSAYGFALILPAHPRKADTSNKGARKLTVDDVAGSGAATRGAEVVLGIERLGHGYARLRYLKDRDGDLQVGEALALIYSKQHGFRPDPRDAEPDAEIEAKVLATKLGWTTVKEWAPLLGVRESKARQILANLAAAGRVGFMIGPPGRSTKAHCYATDPEAWDQSGSVAQLPLATGTDPDPSYGVRGSVRDQSTEPKNDGISQPSRNPLMDDLEGGAR